MTTSSLPATGTFLDRILARTASDLEDRKCITSPQAMESLASRAPVPLNVHPTLRQSTVSVIAEFKRASPSKGEFPGNPDLQSVIAGYLAGGAGLISCLTDTPFFRGTLDDLAIAALLGRRADPPIGVLRKDFVIDRYQIDEALVQGASCILLIVAALDIDVLRELHSYAVGRGLASFVEIHSEREGEIAVNLGATIIGINNRNLKTFNVDLRLSERLAGRLPEDVIRVGESGISTREDVQRLADVGIDAVLVGESLIRQADVRGAVEHLTGVEVKR